MNYVCLVAQLCLSLSRVWLFVTPWTVDHQAPLSMRFSRQEYWSGLPFPSFSRGSSRPRDWTRVSCISCTGRWILNHCATWEAPEWATWVLNATTGVLIRGRLQEIWHRQEKRMWPQRQRLGWCGHKLRTAGSPQTLQESGRIFPWSLHFYMYTEKSL